MSTPTAEPARLNWKTYGVTLALEEPICASLWPAVQEQIERMRSVYEIALASDLFGPPKPPAPPPTVWQRMRSSLGWWLYSLASRLEPDVLGR